MAGSAGSAVVGHDTAGPRLTLATYHDASEWGFRRFLRSFRREYRLLCFHPSRAMADAYRIAAKNSYATDFDIFRVRLCAALSPCTAERPSQNWFIRPKESTMGIRARIGNLFSSEIFNRVFGDCGNGCRRIRRRKSLPKSLEPSRTTTQDLFNC